MRRPSGSSRIFFPGVGRELITALAVTVVLFYFCPASLTLAALGIVGLTAILVTVLNRIMGVYARAQRATWSEIQRVFDETIQGIDTIKVLAAEEQQAAHFQRHTTGLKKLAVRAGAVLSVFSPGIELLTQLGGLGLVALAYYLIARGKMGLEPFLLFFFYATLLQMSVTQLTRLMATVQTEFTGIRHLAGFLAEAPEAEESHPTVTLPSQSVAIELSGLTFGYPGGRRLYNRAHLLIPANAVTVIDGESGSGKSTLINLLLRLYAPARKESSPSAGSTSGGFHALSCGGKSGWSPRITLSSRRRCEVTSSSLSRTPVTDRFSRPLNAPS